MMQDMITKPAACAGLTIAETLVKRLIHETEGQAANLPLVAFVLNQLYEQRTNHELSEAVYDKLIIIPIRRFSRETQFSRFVYFFPHLSR